MKAGGRQIRNPKFLFRANEKEAPLGGAVQSGDEVD
jgi:hypothetical protein